MKKVIVALALFSLSFSVQAQKKVPDAVKNNFKTKFVNAEKVKYSKETDGSWEVDFVENKVVSSAKFSVTGEWLETEQHTKFSEIPTEVQNFVKTNYAGFDVETCEKVTRPTQQFYEIFVEKGKQNLELIVSLDGKLIEEKKAKKSESKDE
jgi:hypothetical protein